MRHIGWSPTGMKLHLGTSHRFLIGAFLLSCLKYRCSGGFRMLPIAFCRSWYEIAPSPSTSNLLKISWNWSSSRTNPQWLTKNLSWAGPTRPSLFRSSELKALLRVFH